MIRKIITLLLILPFQLFAQKEITLNDVWASGKFYPGRYETVVPMKDGEHYVIVEGGIFINKYEYKTGKMLETIIRSGEMVQTGNTTAIQIEEIVFSEDESKILITSETENIYRRSSVSEFYVWDFKAKKLTRVSENGKQQLASLSPDGSKVAFVRENNIFMKDLTTGKEIQVTTDGKKNSIINGAPDWVYEEEFEFARAFDWSPDGKKIAYIRFDESNVKEFELEYYGKLYPEQFRYKYPKAGESNSIVSVHVYDVVSGNIKSMDIGTEKDQYIPRIKWTTDPNQLCIFRMNRLQNKLELLFADATSGTSRYAFTEENSRYIEVNDYLQFIKDNSFLWVSEKDGYMHIYLYDKNGKQISQVTKGNWDVDKVYGMDEKTGIVYYSSAEVSPMDRQVYAIKQDGTGKRKLTTRKGVNEAEFSTTYKYFINIHSDINSPFYVNIIKTSDLKELKMLENNQKVIDNMKQYGFSPADFFKFKTRDDVELNGWMIKPANFDPSKKYPVLMSVYGGPNSQEVVDQWGYFNFIWFEMLSQKGYIIVSVDGRGTGFRGEEFRKCTYMKMGELETKDQIESAVYLGGLDYVDKSRIGIFGWSYGGYMTALCLTVGADYFKTGLAVAPVTNWRYYDNIYTERFMRTPQENPKGYDDNSPTTYASKLKGKLLLVHGGADDNVHMQNSMEFVDALVKANKQFEMQIYPNKNHGIYGGNTRLHLFTRLTDYLLKNL
ncbi:MAG: S9 family peptidase [Bacteroidota bacterium]